MRKQKKDREKKKSYFINYVLIVYYILVGMFFIYGTINTLINYNNRISELTLIICYVILIIIALYIVIKGIQLTIEEKRNDRRN